jgi:hypothetical protein
MLGLLLTFALSPSGSTDALDRLAAALHGAAAWQALFVQRYVPEGLQTGTTEAGTLTLVAPASLRFDYSGGSPRSFATDGAIARLVDQRAGTCEAVRLDAGTWARLPLAVVLDPAAARRAFVVDARAATVRLVPRVPAPELAELTVTLGPDSLPSEVTVRDSSANLNTFALSGWQAVRKPPEAFFAPALPGARPCEPEQ